MHGGTSYAQQSFIKTFSSRTIRYCWYFCSVEYINQTVLGSTNKLVEIHGKVIYVKCYIWLIFITWVSRADSDMAIIFTKQANVYSQASGEWKRKILSCHSAEYKCNKWFMVACTAVVFARVCNIGVKLAVKTLSS